jgi:hypothetical protein
MDARQCVACEEKFVSKSASESYLKELADRTFLSLWAIPNTFYAPGKELTDLIVPFGDDIIVISDKASRFALDKPIEIAWPRWYRATVSEGMRQLKTAIQRIERAADTVFADARARTPILHDLAPIANKRFHLVAITRPDTDPQAVPAEWPELTYRLDAADKPFVIGPLEIAGRSSTSSTDLPLTCCWSSSTRRPTSLPISRGELDDCRRPRATSSSKRTCSRGR